MSDAMQDLECLTELLATFWVMADKAGLSFDATKELMGDFENQSLTVYTMQQRKAGA